MHSPSVVDTELNGVFNSLVTPCPPHCDAASNLALVISCEVFTLILDCGIERNSSERQCGLREVSKKMFERSGVLEEYGGFFP